MQVVTFTRENDSDNWSCYAFDIARGNVNVYDPTIPEDNLARAFGKHVVRASFLMGSLQYCYRNVLAAKINAGYRVNVMAHKGAPSSRYQNTTFSLVRATTL